MPVVIGRLIAAEVEYMRSLFHPLQSVPGGAETATFAGAVAFYVQGNGDPLFNRVLGFGEESVRYLDEIMDWYAERDSPCRFEVVSAPLTRQSEVALVRRGYSPHTIETFLCSAPQPSSLPPGEVQVRKLTPDELDEFASAFLAVYRCEPAAERAVRDCLKAQYDQPGWHCYLADIGGETAGFGAMRVHAGTASLISSATVPSLRRRGCQTALLARRMADAVDLGCDLVFSHAACGSTSQNNMERLGMRAVAPKLRWERSP